LRVRNCETGDTPNDYSYTDGHTGTVYYGPWQMNAEFWVTYGGDRSWLSRPFRAPRWMQNLVAYRGWLDRGWQPWECGNR
jgi:hypothetical protein